MYTYIHTLLSSVCHTVCFSIFLPKRGSGCHFISPAKKPMNHPDHLVDMKTLSVNSIYSWRFGYHVDNPIYHHGCTFSSNFSSISGAALQMSVQDSAKEVSNQNDMNKVLGDQSFVSSILASVYVLSWSIIHWHCKSLLKQGCLIILSTFQFSSKHKIEIICFIWRQ